MRFGQNVRSGGVLAVVLVIRRVVARIDASSKREAQRLAPSVLRYCQWYRSNSGTILDGCACPRRHRASCGTRTLAQTLDTPRRFVKRLSRQLPALEHRPPPRSFSNSLLIGQTVEHETHAMSVQPFPRRTIALRGVRAASASALELNVRSSTHAARFEGRERTARLHTFT